MKRTVDYQGRKVEGTEVSFDIIRQNWNEYTLNDGTTIKLQTITTSIVRIDGEYSNQGDPIYVISTQNIVTASNIPDHMRKVQ